MALETENRIHASAVCFWEIAQLAGPGDNFVRGGMQARHNVRAIAIPNPQQPEAIILDLVRPIAKERALPLITDNAGPNNNVNAGVSVGPPATPLTPAGPGTVEELINNMRDDQVAIYELEPPFFISAGEAPGSFVGMRSFFYFMLLEVPTAEPEPDP